MSYEVLLVDDDDPTRSVYHEILARMKVGVSDAADGVAALDILRRRSPDLVILDLLLPRVSGREVLDYIYASPHLAATRVIIFSAHEGLFPLHLRPGDEFLLKPLNPQTFRDAVTRAMNYSSVEH